MAETQKEITLREISHGYFDDAKFWWGLALVCKLAGPVLGALFIIGNLLPNITPLIVLVLALISELCAWRSDTLKGIAEGLLRKLDLHDSFGWGISPGEQADLVADLSPRRQNAFLSREVARDYFASKEPPGTLRALWNLRESAWWSKKLAKRMGWICLVVTGIGIIGALAALLIAVQTVQTVSLLPKIGRLVIAFILAILSVGVARLTASYYSFSAKAEATENRAQSLIDAGDMNEATAIKLWQEYHMARAMAPMWPTLLWRVSRNTLNTAWSRAHPQAPVGDGGSS